MMLPISPHLDSVDACVIGAYLLVTLLLASLGFRRSTQSNDFLNATRSQPAWIVTLSFLAANVGAIEVLSVTATTAQFGAKAFDFYWIGAIPALICLSLFILPVYERSGIRSIPDYLARRYDERTRTANAGLTLAMTVLLAGASLHAIAIVMQSACGWPVWWTTCLAVFAAAVYTTLGGLRATLYTEALQLVLLLAVLVPLQFPLLLPNHGAYPSMLFRSHTADHLWHGVPWESSTSQLDGIGLVVGLGLVLSFGYWCTDFVMIQRVVAVKSIRSARQIPLWAGFGKIAFGFLLILPVLGRHQGQTSNSYTAVLPDMLMARYDHGWKGLAVTALLASLISNLAANTSAFSALWTEELYRPRIKQPRDARHFVRVGRLAHLIALFLCIGAASAAGHFSNVMEYIQLLFSVMAAPLFAIVLAGMAIPAVKQSSGIWGLGVGVAVAVAHLCLYTVGWIHYGSTLNSNFHCAIYAFTAAVVGLLVASQFRTAAPNSFALNELTLGAGQGHRNTVFYLATAIALGALCLWLNLVWW